MPTAPASGFQGRDPELAQIRGELERLADGEETGIIVGGAAGIGRRRTAKVRVTTSRRGAIVVPCCVSSSRTSHRPCRRRFTLAIVSRGGSTGVVSHNA